MFTITQIEDHLGGMAHGTSVAKVTNINSLFERAAATMLLKYHPLEAIRFTSLANLVHDDVYNYALPYDFGSIIDLSPDDHRDEWDTAVRDKAKQFDLQKAVASKTISIEAVDGTKQIRINWKSRSNKVLNAMNSVTANGTWAASGTAANVVTDNIQYKSGNGSVRFDVVASGDGIQNTTMTPIDLTLESRVASIFQWVYFSSVANLTSVGAVFGNDLTANYWTAVPQTTQADGSPFKTGWNLVKWVWSSSTQTGTVAPATIDSFRLVINSTGAILNVRADNIIVSIGRPFDLKYYSKYIFKSASSGLWISIPQAPDDMVMIDNDGLPQFLMECLVQMSQQLQGKDGQFDLTHALGQLQTLYPAYKGAYPSMVKKATGSIGGLPRGIGRRHNWRR